MLGLHFFILAIFISKTRGHAVPTSTCSLGTRIIRVNRFDYGTVKHTSAKYNFGCRLVFKGFERNSFIHIAARYSPTNKNCNHPGYPYLLANGISYCPYDNFHDNVHKLKTDELAFSVESTARSFILDYYNYGEYPEISRPILLTHTTNPLVFYKLVIFIS